MKTNELQKAGTTTKKYLSVNIGNGPALPVAGRGDVHEQVEATMHEAQRVREVEYEIAGVGWIQDVAEGGALHEVHPERRDGDVGKPEDEGVNDLRGRDNGRINIHIYI